MSVIVAGDIHGDWGYFNALINRKKPEIILQCGDFGWWPHIKERGRGKPWSHLDVKPQGSKIYFCDGNHEDHHSLRACLPEEINGPVELYPSVYYMPRGTTLTLPDGRTVLFMGGADSIDKDLRIIGHDWFPEELISQQDLDRALSQKGPIDIVISHTCPWEWTPRASLSKKNDPSREALSRILERFSPALWYHGHWHHYKEGLYENTHWISLNYPRNGWHWWMELK